jgi:hypothetical protein
VIERRISIIEGMASNDHAYDCFFLKKKKEKRKVDINGGIYIFKKSRYINNKKLVILRSNLCNFKCDSHVSFVSFKIDVAFKITIRLKFNND